MKAMGNMLRSGAVVVLASAGFSCSREERSATEAEGVVRQFLMAMLVGDGASLRQCILTNQDAAALCSVKTKPEELAEAKAKIGQMTIRRASPGESVSLPDGGQFTVKAEMLSGDRTCMVCMIPGEKFGGPVWVVREGEHWKVDAEPWIALARRAMRHKAAAQVNMLSTALEMHYNDTGKYPTTEEGLKMLTAAPSEQAAKQKWSGPYLEGDIPMDPWGTPYRYACPGMHNRPRFDLFSCGPDKREGGGDDIGNWPEQR